MNDAGPVPAAVRRPAISLHGQLTLASLAVFVLFALGSALVNKYSFEARFRDVAGERVTLLAQTINFAFETMIDRNDVASLQRLVENVGSNPEVRRLTIVDRNLTILADEKMTSDRAEEQERILTHEKELLTRALQGKHQVIEEQGTEGTRVLTVAMPLRGGRYFPELHSDIVGVIRLSYDLHSFRAAAERNTVATIIAQCVTFLAVLLALNLLARRLILKPIRQLAQASHLLAQGDLAARVPATSRSEIGELERAFNHMTDRLRQLVSQREEAAASIARAAALQNMNDRLQTEIAERQRAEDAIRTSHERLRNILDGMFTFVGLVSLDGVLLDANRAPLEACKFRKEDVIGKPFADLDAWSYSPAVQGDLRAALARAAQGETVRYDTRIRIADERLIDLDACFAPLRDAQGKIVQVLGSGVDITARKQVEQKFRESQDSLAAQREAALNLAQDEFVARQRAVQAEQELRKLNTELEQRVRDRTADVERQASLIAAINDAQAKFISAEDPLHVFDGFLKNLLSLTGSAFGFIDELLYTDDGKPYLTARAITNIAWNDETRALHPKFLTGEFRFDSLKSLFGVVITTGAPVIANDAANDPRRGVLPIGHPALKAFLGLPMLAGDELVGVIGLANAPGGYGDQTVAYLEPMVKACANIIAAWRNEQRRRQVEEVLTEQARLAVLAAETSTALTRAATLRDVLQLCAAAVVRHLDAVFARVWTLNEPDQVLELQASAGLYTHLDGPHGRVPVGQLKIGRIAREKQPHLTNDVCHDPHVSDPEWARRQGMVAFAGHPLLVDGALVGVLALFARQPLSERALRALASVADTIALGIKRKQSQDSLQQANRELEQRGASLAAANKELEAFSYSISHDLRAPLRAIDGFARILLGEQSAALSPEAREYLQDIRTNTQQMGHLVDDLLGFARLSRQPLTKETVAVADLVRQCLASLRGDQEGRRVEVRVAELPQCQADPALLKQVWLNLLGNALKYTSKREAAAIEAGSYRDDGTGELVYFVKDNGVGFDMRYADKLFGVFQRLHRAEDYEGTGVGLAIVQRIVHRHGGRVWADARPDRGASFFFTLEGAPVHA